MKIQWMHLILYKLLGYHMLSFKPSLQHLFLSVRPPMQEVPTELTWATVCDVLPRFPG